MTTSLRASVLVGDVSDPRLAGFLAAPTLEAWFGDAPATALERDIAALDALISRQLDAILHAPRLRRLEGAWRGLAWLLGGIDPAVRIKVRLLVVTWQEIARDLERAAEFDQSHLFRKIYEEEFGMPGGEPYGLLVIDHEARHRPAPGVPTDDPTIIAQLGAIAAAAFAPTVLAVSPALLDANAWSDLAMTLEPASPLRDPAHARWSRLGALDDSRFVAAVAPRVLARPPWADDASRRDHFRYAEYAPTANERVWMSAVYPFASTVARAFTNFGWPADVRGVDADREGGGLVLDLPAEGYSTEREPLWPRPPLEIVLNERQERSLVEGGLMPLAGLPFVNDAAFVAVRSLQVPASYAGERAAAADANARLSAQFSAMLCVSRFAHYVKIIGRDMTGSFKTADDIERRLQDWLTRYVNTNVNAGPEDRARAPLLAGRVDVREIPDRPGSFGCTIFLQPHFQLDDVSATFRLTTDIVSLGRAA